jgi:hypothetical protein
MKRANHVIKLFAVCLMSCAVVFLAVLALGLYESGYDSKNGLSRGKHFVLVCLVTSVPLVFFKIIFRKNNAAKNVEQKETKLGFDKESEEP